MGNNKSKSGNGTTNNKGNDTTLGGWTEQDLANAKIMSDARTLAKITTDNIQDEPNFQFSFSEATTDVTDLTTQVVNGTNYRLEYSIRDAEGDHVLYVTSTLYRPPQAPLNKAEVIKKDYALENVNRAHTTPHDTTSKLATTPQQRKRFTRAH